MKIAILGIGAVGGWLACSLAKAEANVTLIARGENFNALQKSGLTVLEKGVEHTFKLPVLEKITSQKFDCIIVATKTNDNEALIASLSNALTENGLLVTAQNGLPHWFLAEQGIGAEISHKAQDVAGVVHCAATLLKPAFVQIEAANKFILGTPQGLIPARLKALSALLQKGGITTPISNAIRIDIWAKLWGNMSMNPISALTRLSKTPMFEEPHTFALLKEMMHEFVVLGKAINIEMSATVDERLMLAAKLGDFKTSTLKDVERGNALEIEGLLGVLLQIAEKKQVAIPVSRVVYGLCKGLNQSLGGK